MSFPPVPPPDSIKPCLLLLTPGLVGILLTIPTEPALAQEMAAPDLQALLQQALAWIDSLGTAGAIAFMALYIVATVAFLPGTLLTLGAGLVFGVVQGSIYVFIGASLGAILAFLVGRYLVRGWVAQRIADNQRFRAIDAAVGREGLKIVLLTRLSPVFPFNLLNYLFGITGVSLRDYALGCVGMIPGTLLYVYIGSLAGDLARLSTAQPVNPGAQWAFRLIGFTATVAVTVFVTRIARSAYAEAVEADQQPASGDRAS